MVLPQLTSDTTQQVVVPKRSQSSQDMLHMQPRSTRPSPSLASTPEKPAEAEPEAAEGQKGASNGETSSSNGQPQRAGGLGLLGRVASGLLGSGSKRASSDKKVRLRCSCNGALVFAQFQLCNSQSSPCSQKRYSHVKFARWHIQAMLRTVYNQCHAAIVPSQSS